MDKPSDGRPIARRFIIKRHPLALATRSPWVLRDRSRPAYLGHFATHDLALAAVDRKLAEERGYVPSVAEIREAMTAAEDHIDPIAAFGRELREKYGNEPGMVAIGSTR
ncbi:hypothetical protein ACFDTO_31225 [Microbacteriaceae bacterium 4G12]|nr:MULTISPECIES: hypothetical protein [Bacteria]KAB5323507.1 hypothetical protein F9951_18495 [Bacteroides stercoris]MTU01726.1 hypothetical protein [Parasutterella excrementihominis]MTU25066.1 hypothetical protein [Parasutterella excrementihominis]MTU33809.1 hypothetical protein [Parasutterella excrementihominis]